MFSYQLFEELDSFYDWIIEPLKKKKGDASIKTDSRVKHANALFVPLVGENFNGHEFLKKAIEQGASVICSAEAFTLEVIRLAKKCGVAVFTVSDTLTFYQEVAAAHRQSFKDLKLIAITGSSGKTSTKEILATMLGDHTLKTEANTNNLIGLPQNLLRLTAKHKYAVLELGTNQFGEIEQLTKICQPNLAIITNIGGAHLEFFKDRAGVAKEKTSLFRQLEAGTTVIYPKSEAENPEFKESTANLKAITFGKANCGADWEAEETAATLSNSTVVIKSNTNQTFEFNWQLKGDHQALNAATAMAAVKALEVEATKKELLARLTDLKLPGMRGAITQKKEITWINDAYNANAESTIASLEWLKKINLPQDSTLHIVLGDMLELGESSAAEHQKVIAFLQENNFKAKVWLIGEAYSKLDSVEGYSTFLDTRSCKKEFKPEANDTVFLKGSRGIKLEFLI